MSPLDIHTDGLKGYERRELERENERTAEAALLGQIEAHLGGILDFSKAAATGDVLAQGTARIGPDGTWSLTWPVQYQAMAIANTSTGDLTVFAGPPTGSGSPPSTGAGIFIVRAGIMRTVSIRNTAVTVYGTPGALFDVTLYSRPREPNAGPVATPGPVTLPLALTYSGPSTDVVESLSLVGDEFARRLVRASGQSILGSPNQPPAWGTHVAGNVGIGSDFQERLEFVTDTADGLQIQFPRWTLDDGVNFLHVTAPFALPLTVPTTIAVGPTTGGLNPAGGTLEFQPAYQNGFLNYTSIIDGTHLGGCTTTGIVAVADTSARHAIHVDDSFGSGIASIDNAGAAFRGNDQIRFDYAGLDFTSAAFDIVIGFLDDTLRNTGSGIFLGNDQLQVIKRINNAGNNEFHVITDGHELVLSVAGLYPNTAINLGTILNPWGKLFANILTVLGQTGANTQSRIAGGTIGGAPVAGTFAVGDVVVDTVQGLLRVATGAGTPGTWAVPIGAQVAYNEVAANFTNASAAGAWQAADTTSGASPSITLPNDGFTYKVEFLASFWKCSIADLCAVGIGVDATHVSAAQQVASLPTTNNFMPPLVWPNAIGAGQTLKIFTQASVATHVVTIGAAARGGAGATEPASLAAYRVA